MADGYRNIAYAESLAEFGTPHRLERSGAFILERAIPGGSLKDAMGCYPLFSCLHWDRLGADLEVLGERIVSLALVSDPFATIGKNELRKLFPDRLFAFKSHHIADLQRRPDEFVSLHHRYYAKRAMRSVVVERAKVPSAHLDEWMALYAELITRHEITGVQAFSHRVFEQLLALPDIVMFRAIHRGRAVATHLWMLQSDVAHSHLLASNATGYEVMASYALYWTALDALRSEVRWLNFGAGAGVKPNDKDGLDHFKRGWANTTRPAYFCGRIFDKSAYYRLAVQRDRTANGSFFPAYRAGL